MNMRTITHLVLAGMAALLAGCSNPLDKPFNRETAESDFTRIVKLGRIDSAEAATMAEFMVEKELIGTQVLEIGATYRDILEQAKAISKEKADQLESEAARKKEAVKAPEFVRASLDLLPAVQPATLSTTGLKFRLQIENISGKRLKAVKGKISVSDTFGESVHTIEYRLLDPLELGEKTERVISVNPQDLNNATRILDYQRSVPFSAQWESLDFRF